jgi:hypothetical protein
VGGLHRSERATTTDLRAREIRRVFYGERAVIEAPLPGQLAHIDARAGRGRYAMRAELGDLAVEVHFPIDDINALFQDRAGLEANGEAFLTDSIGYRLTSTTYAAPTDFQPHAADRRLPERHRADADDRISRCGRHQRRHADHLPAVGIVTMSP